MIFREKISKDIYIYLEEVLILKNFEFWPHVAMDIEKPSSAAKEYEFIWRLPVKYEMAKHHTWIKNYMIKHDSGIDAVHLRV